MTIGDAAISSGDLMREIRELKRQVRELAAARRLESASIGAGGLRIKDGGKLTVEDGTGAIAELSALAGMRAATVSVEELQSDTGGAFVDLPTPGPTISGVPITASGRALAIVSAEIVAPPGGPDTEILGFAGFVASGASTLAASTSRSAVVAYKRPGGDSGAPYVFARSTAAVLLEGLNTGTHTFAMTYRTDVNGTGGGQSHFRTRTLIIIPF